MHEDALAEIRHLLRDEVEFYQQSRPPSDALKIGQWAEEIHRKLGLSESEPEEDRRVVVHKRLLDDTIRILGGSLQTLTTAHAQLDTATQKMNVAAYQAALAIQDMADDYPSPGLGVAPSALLPRCRMHQRSSSAVVWLLFLRSLETPRFQPHLTSK